MAPNQLEIKSKALGRLVKEYSLYQQEITEQAQHVESLKAKNHDEYEIKKQIEVLEDTKRVIAEVLKKIEDSYLSLQEYVGQLQGVNDLTLANQNFEAAEKLLEL